MFDATPVSPYSEEPQAETAGGSCDPAAKSCSSCRMTKVIRGVVAFLAIGTAGVYGAITAKPEMAEYLSFLPGMKGNGICSASVSGCSSGSSCSSATCTEACPSSGCPSACSVASRAKLMESCSAMADAAAPATEGGIALTEAAFEPEAGSASEAPAASEGSELPPAPPLPVRQ